MRALVLSTASFLFGVAISVGDFQVPQWIAKLLLVAGALGYLWALTTWSPVLSRLLRARKEQPVLSTVVVGLVGALMFVGGFWLLRVIEKPEQLSIYLECNLWAASAEVGTDGRLYHVQVGDGGGVLSYISGTPG